MKEALFMILGAVLSVLIGWFGKGVVNAVKRKNPIDLQSSRSKAAPLWFATDREIPKTEEEAQRFDSEVMIHDPFCGFGKIDITVKNTSNDVVYITDIVVKKEKIVKTFDTRVFFMLQGGCSPLRLNAVLDDENVVLAEDLKCRHFFQGGYFSSGNKLKVLPGEVELIKLGFITVNSAWSFNCDVHYFIAESERVVESIFGDDETIVPYMPDEFKRDYNSIIEFSGTPKYGSYDRFYFSEEMRAADPGRQHRDDASAIEYLSKLL